MAISVGDNSIDQIYVGSAPVDAVFVGYTQVWPTVEFPYIVENTKLVDANVPAGCKGAWVNLIGGGANGNSGSGGGGAGIGPFFLFGSDMGSTFTVQFGGAGVPTVFSTGSVVLTAGGGSGTSAGTASQVGISYAPLFTGASGAGNGTVGAGGAGGYGAYEYGSTNSPQQANALAGGSSSPFVPVGRSAGHVPGRGGSPAGNRSSRSRIYGGGGGWYNGSDAVGGGGGCRLEFVNKIDITTAILSTGAWAYTLPGWLRSGDKVDVVAMPGGAGGTKGGSTSAGKGGNAGAFVYASLTVGTDIAVGATLTGSVGAGGAKNGGAGGNTTATATGWSGLAATGASGTVSGIDGASSVDVVVNGQLYLGGGGASGSIVGVGAGGGQPGAGGAGGGSILFIGQDGGVGGSGGVYIRCWQPVP